MGLSRWAPMRSTMRFWMRPTTVRLHRPSDESPSGNWGKGFSALVKIRAEDSFFHNR